MKKRVFAFIMLIALLVMPVMSALASSGGVYVIDEGTNLTQSELESLNKKAAKIEAEQGFKPMFAIVGDTGGSVTDYLENLYKTNGNAENGLILGYSETEKKWSFVLFGEAESLLEESDVDALWEAYDEASTYIGGVNGYLDSVSRTYAERSLGALPVVTDEPVVTAEPAGEPGAHVVDLADLMSGEEESKLREKLETISAKHNCDVVVVTVNSTGSKTPMAFADDYQDYNGYKPDGILLLISMAEKDWWVTTKGTGIDAVTKDALQKIEDDIIGDLKNKQYYNAFNTYGELCDDFLTRAENGKPYKKPLISTVFAAIGSAVVGLLSGGGVAGSAAAKLKSVRHKTNASDYVEKGSLNIVNRSEYFLYSNVTKTEIPRDDGRSSGGGGTHISSSGSTHGGGGGKF